MHACVLRQDGGIDDQMRSSLLSATQSQLIVTPKQINLERVQKCSRSQAFIRDSARAMSGACLLNYAEGMQVPEDSRFC